MALAVRNPEGEEYDSLTSGQPDSQAESTGNDPVEATVITLRERAGSAQEKTYPGLSPQSRAELDAFRLKNQLDAMRVREKGQRRAKEGYSRITADLLESNQRLLAENEALQDQVRELTQRVEELEAERARMMDDVGLVDKIRGIVS